MVSPEKKPQLNNFSPFYKNNPPLGAHTSIAGGLCNAVYSGKEIGCDVIQIFSKNQMQWRGKSLSAEEVDKFLAAAAETNIIPLVVHDSYLINLASPDSVIYQKSFAAVVDELQRCEILKIPYLVIHPGSHLGVGEQKGLDRLAKALYECYYKAMTVNTSILLETTAGQGSNLGYTFEQLKYLLDQSRLEDKIGVCLDTCHIYAAGYDLRSRKTWESSKKKFDRTIGRERLKIIHANDSERELGSRVDRHARVGEGEIGLGGFSVLVNDPDLQKIPLILEIPGGEKAYRKDIQILRKLKKRK
jgi:deoxyribonuclease IV